MTGEEILYISNNQEYIRKNILADTFELSLKSKPSPEKKLLHEQIRSLQKIRKKLPQWYETVGLVFPHGLSLEQSSSEATAQLKASLIAGKELIDITGGLGVDAYYLSHSFKSTTYVEENQELEAVVNHNFKLLDSNIKTLSGDGLKVLQNSNANMVYIDPYRRDPSRQKVVRLEDCLPDVTAHLDLLLANERRALIKTSPMLDIHKATEQLKWVTEVWIISVRNECKEVVYLVDKKASKRRTRTFNITKDSLQTFEFEHIVGKPASTSTSMPLKFLFEPNASIMKSGGQDILASSLGLMKLHPNSHLYTSDKIVDDFPGRVFSIQRQTKPFEKSLKKGRYNVISRNFPAKANEIESKLKLKPAKEDYLFATQLEDNSLCFIVGQLVR